MKWTRIKNIMLFFLIAMNIFMIAFISVTTIQRTTVEESVIEASLKVLEDTGFQCDKELFPTTYTTLPSLNAHFYSASDLSELFFGKQVAFRTVENLLIAKDGRATLTVDGNYFSYTNGYDADTSYSQKELKKALAKTGIDMSGAVYDDKEKTFYKMYNNTNLFNMYISAQLDSDGEICHISAQWPKSLIQAENREISFVESIMDVKSAFPQGGKIDNIELGYSLSSAGGDKYIFNPAWRVKIGNEIKILE